MAVTAGCKAWPGQCKGWHVLILSTDTMLTMWFYQGLANVKVAKVQGVKQKPEVLQHLFGLIHESECKSSSSTH